ncbi:hypothetical protein [Allobaculum sp. Allo2]|uniref:hypothetical protein n=1 Tax=Allobaculum sp. Allo2 TaxID=2853432 RepID=UPI001F604363|nr:hypothetical protein [Allobaculum sp. Allo2]
MNFWKQLNLPNKLTVLRMVMVPVLWIVYLCIPADWLLMSKEAGFGLRNLLALLLLRPPRLPICSMAKSPVRVI